VRSKTPLTVTILGGVAALALTGCTPQTGGSGGPTTATSTTTASSAPTIANPLNTANYQKNLCGGLTAAQLAPYVGTVGDSGNVDGQSGSSSCGLHPKDNSMATVYLAIYPTQTASDMLASASNFPYSKKLDPIQGYPALTTSQGNPPNGECGTSVAVADHVVVEVSAQASSSSFQYYNNMCAVTEALAPQLVSNLKTSG
jgi:hypothetical protein